jgi:hypothetical protein
MALNFGERKKRQRGGLFFIERTGKGRKISAANKFVGGNSSWYPGKIWICVREGGGRESNWKILVAK